MIEQISLNNINTRTQMPQKQPSFKGMDAIGSGFIKAIQACERQPMLNVTVLDVATAIGPRSIYDTIKTNIYAGFESLRRESSGLLINCIIPGFIVAGFAKLIQKPIMGENSKMNKSWANEETIKTISHYWKKSKGQGDVKVENTYKDMLRDLYGINGKDKVNFKDFNLDEAVAKLKHETINDVKRVKGEESAFDLIAKKTLVTEHVKTLSGVEYSGGLKTLTEETPKILKEFIKHNIVDEASISEFIKKSKRLVTAKSLLGLGVIIPLAIAAQPINRWITAKTSGKKGAPIYRDFADSQQKELSSEQKAKLAKHKLASVGAMVGVALLSIMKKPNLAMLKDITQFKSIFPSMDQARIIATATFASRMMASEDENELREVTVRDIATFSAFYFLGDYVAKGIATFMPKHKLINTLKEAKPNANVLEQFWHWAKHTSLKSSDELATETAKKMRSVCQLGNIGFSLLALGILIPMITRNKTDKKHEEELKKMGVPNEIISKYYPPFAMNNSHSDSKRDVYQAFFTSK